MRIVTYALIVLSLTNTVSRATVPEVEDGLIVLKWDSTCQRTYLDALVDSLNGTYEDSIPYWPTYYIGFADTLSAWEAADWFASKSCVIWAEPVEVSHPGTNDPMYEDQWYLDHLIEEGYASAELSVNEAWALENGGDRSVRIAVIDEGIQWEDGALTHPDLQNDPGESDYPFEMRPFPPDQPLTPDEDHGTQVTGLIAANTDNNEGIAGVAHRCTILNYKAFTPQRMHDAIDLNSGNCDIVTTSRCLGDFAAYRQEIGYARDNGVLFVFLVGNRLPNLDDYCSLT